MTELDVKKGPRFGVRHVQTFLLFLVITVTYCERLCVSVALVAMTNAASTNIDFHEFNWDEKHRSYVLSAFYWGYILTQIPAGFFGSRVGVKLMMLLSIFCSSLCAILTPMGVGWGGWQTYCVLRFIQGLAQGFVFPLVHTHVATWSPCEELTRLGGLSHTGLEFGSIMAMALSGFIAGSALGWPGVFYVFGGIGLGFCIVWMIFAEESPSRSKSISLEEKDYILGSQSKAKDSQAAKIPIPWRAIFTSVPFLSLTLAGMCEMWGSSTLQAYIPAYMHGILKVNINNNAIFSTMPFLAMWISSFLFTFVADFILKKRWASLGVVRKLVNTIGMWTPAALLIVIGFLDASQTSLVLILMILIGGFNAGYTVGGLLNMIDLSPNHAGVLMGILNAICNIMAICAPLVAGSILSDEASRTQWQMVFLITAVIFFVGNLQFIFLGSTDVQPWNDESFMQGSDAENKNKSKTDIAMKSIEENK